VCIARHRHCRPQAACASPARGLGLTHINDFDPLRKYLAQHGLSWACVSRRPERA